jgi:hypothetical protein
MRRSVPTSDRLEHDWRPDDEVSTLVAGVLNDRRTPTDPAGMARTVRDVLSAARMLGPNAYPRAEQIASTDDGGDCDRDPDCVRGDAHGGPCMDADDAEEWATH